MRLLYACVAPPLCRPCMEKSYGLYPAFSNHERKYDCTVSAVRIEYGSAEVWSFLPCRGKRNKGSCGSAFGVIARSFFKAAIGSNLPGPLRIGIVTLCPSCLVFDHLMFTRTMLLKNNRSLRTSCSSAWNCLAWWGTRFDLRSSRKNATSTTAQDATCIPWDWSTKGWIFFSIARVIPWECADLRVLTDLFNPLRVNLTKMFWKFRGGCPTSWLYVETCDNLPWIVAAIFPSKAKCTANRQILVVSRGKAGNLNLSANCR